MDFDERLMMFEKGTEKLPYVVNFSQLLFLSLPLMQIFPFLMLVVRFLNFRIVWEVGYEKEMELFNIRISSKFRLIGSRIIQLLQPSTLHQHIPAFVATSHRLIKV